MPLPTYDPEKDGNPFEWILRSAWERRLARYPATRRALAADQKAAMDAHDASVEAEERAHFQSLRDRNKRTDTAPVAYRKPR